MIMNPLTQQPIADGDLAGVSQLANKLLGIQADVATREAELALLKQREAELSTNLIPEAMVRIGMTKFVLENGVCIEVEPFYTCSLSDEYPELKTRGIAWLRANTYGSLVKNQVAVDLNTDSEKLLRMLKKYLDKHAFSYRQKEMVHPQTLKSLMRELLQSGKEFPMEVFRAFVGKRTKLTT